MLPHIIDYFLKICGIAVLTKHYTISDLDVVNLFPSLQCYWLKRINVCFMKQNAIAIDNRIKILKEDKMHKNDPAHSILTEGIRANYQK